MTVHDERWRVVRETLGDGRLSVVMPVYNLAGSIAENLRRTAELFEAHQVRAELVPVDDGSADGTAEVLLAAATGAHNADSRYVSVVPVVLERNGGKGAALRAGFSASSGEFVMLLDGDLDINPAQTPAFFAVMRERAADIVVGSKRHPLSQVQYPWHRRIVSWIYFTLVRWTVSLPITDTQTGMKLFRRAVLGEALARMLVKTYAFDLELLAIARQRGARIAEAPVSIRFGQKFGALSWKTVKAMTIDSLAVFYRLRMLDYYRRVEVPPPSAAPAGVSVVIACPGDSAMLREGLAAILAGSLRPLEIVVLPDEPFEWQGDSAVVVHATGKVRPAEKRNAGIALARGEVVAFIDDDAYPDANWLEYAVKYFTDASVGAVGGPGVTPPNDSRLRRLGGEVYENPLVSGGYRYRYRAGGVRRDVDDFPSCNLLVRKSVLEAIGGYRTDFWPGEDTLLCRDILAHGLRIVYDPWVVVYHHRRALFAAHLRQLGRYAFHRGYFVKRYPDNSRHFAYFVPTAFVAYLAAAPAALLLPDCWAWAALSPLGLYLAALVATCLRRNPFDAAIVALGVVASHCVYGVRFACGMLARKAPCEYIGKDRAV